VAEAKIFLGAGFGDELLPFPFLFLRDFLNLDEAPRGSIMEETVEPSLSESESWGGESSSSISFESDSQSSECPFKDIKMSKGFVLRVAGPTQGVEVVKLRPTLGIVKPKGDYGAACGWPTTHGLAKASGEVACRGVGEVVVVAVLVVVV
jgi:hypothetical protein